MTALTWYLGTTQQTFFYMLMVALHLLPGPCADRAVLDLRLRASGDLVEAAEQDGDPLRSGTAGRCAGHPGLGPRPGSASAASRSAIRGSATSATGCTWPRLWRVALYVKHRLAGPRIRWEWARRLAIPVAGFVVLMGLLHSQDPTIIRRQGAQGRKQYFYPSEAVTANGKFIPAQDADDGRLLPEVPQGCLRRLVSLGAPSQLVQQQGLPDERARDAKVALERDGSTQAARWCAGCHDPVPFFSGEFDDPNYDDVHNPTSQAGITCTTCHAITTSTTPGATPLTRSRSPSIIPSPSATTRSCSGST